MRKLARRTLSRTKPYLFLAWPVCAVLAAALMWANIASNDRTERDTARALLIEQSGTYAEAYALYLTRSIAQMDQVTMQLKHSWEHAARSSLLEDMKAEGMFSDPAFINVSIIDRNGIIRSSTRAHSAERLNTTAFFAAHRDSNSSALRIGVAPPDTARHPLPWTGQDVVLLTRRLDTRDDEFDGVVLMAIDAGYFTSFINNSMLGRGGLLAVASQDRQIWIEQQGAGAARLGGSTTGLVQHDQFWLAARSGAKIAARDSRSDGHTRAIGWQDSIDYPLTAIVALPLANALAPAAAHWRDSRNNAVASTVCLLLLGFLASFLTLRAAARDREQAEVRRVYRAATEHAKDGFYMASPVHDRLGTIVDFRIDDCNEQGAWFYGYERSSLVGRLLSQVNRGEEYTALIASYLLAMENGFFEEDRFLALDPRMQIQWGHRRLVRVGRGLAITLQDISERKAHEEETARLVNEDSLTRLPNRHAFLQFAQQALDRAAHAGGAAAMLFIDLDDFKQVNDTHGHGAGDHLLRSAAQRLVALLRPHDRVARFGGDEFIVLLDGEHAETHGAAVAERIIAAFSQPFPLAEGVQALIGASVGIALFPGDGSDAATLIQHADMAMYSGKKDGKAQYRFFDRAISAAARQRMQVKQRLSDAIDVGHLQLHYQPRVNTVTGQLCSMEALLRWHDPVLGHVPPDQFIGIAETNGLILRIGELVLEQACTQLAAWQAAGLEVVPVSINISPKQFARRGLARQVAAALTRHGLPAALLQIEITESAMMGEQYDVVAELAALRALGVALYVDDFGTGYSSLSQLQRLRMDGLKVDRAFTSQLDVSAEGQVFFQAIVSMAHALGMSVVAEGVETLAQRQTLATLRCDELQGYFMARPMPAANMALLLARSSAPLLC